jgi:hypothetical protein
LSIEPVHHFRATGAAKNSSDIHLVVDAMELLYRSPVDTFVIVSADSDFVGLVSKLRASGKTVIGAGRQDVVSTTLVKSCDRYIYLGTQAAPSPTQHRAPAAQPEAPSDSLLVRAMEASTDDHGLVPGSRLYATMTRIDPGFSFKALGYQTFTQFLETSSLVKVTRSRGPGDTQVEWNATNSQSQPQTAPTGWDQQIHAAWSERAPSAGEALNGPRAATEAARILGIPRLKGSQYPTLQSLLDSSDLLRASWTRRGNSLIRQEQ